MSIYIFFCCLFAHLSMKCSWWTIVVSQCPSCVVRRPSWVVCRVASTIALKAYSSYTPGPIDSILGRKHQGACRSENQDGRHRRHLENLFFTSSPEPKGQLTPNLLGSMGVTCRSKIAKIMLIGNPRWLPWPPSWKSFSLLLNRKANWLQTC